MSKKALVEVDSQIAKIRADVQEGLASQIAQVEIHELLDERAKLIRTMAGPTQAEESQSGSA
jgi:hypothetical protein